jgi:hypothetical protein
LHRPPPTKLIVASCLALKYSRGVMGTETYWASSTTNFKYENNTFED